MKSICPGQDKRNIKAESIKCSKCEYELEIFSDEIKRVCPRCKNLVCREHLPSCIDWCKAAKSCVGEKFYNDYLEEKRVTLRDKLLKELEKYFGNDSKRINHAKKVLCYAENLAELESADWYIIIPVSILHDVGIKQAETKYGSSAGNYQEKEGPAIAREILINLGVKKENIDEICEIIAHHHSPGKINTQNFKVLYDADWLVNLKDEVGLSDKEKLSKIINNVFLTKTGREKAKEIYLNEDTTYGIK